MELNVINVKLIIGVTLIKNATVNIFKRMFVALHHFIKKIIFVLACDCNPEGSATQQCNQITGHCNCMLGIGGEKCDICARGYLGTAPNCSPCGECFENWDQAQKELNGKINYE